MVEAIIILIALIAVFYLIREPQKLRGPSYFLRPRYKRYAPWPFVLWCRQRSHAGQGRWHSGDVSRCIGCGDIVDR